MAENTGDSQAAMAARGEPRYHGEDMVQEVVA